MSSADTEPDRVVAPDPRLLAEAAFSVARILDVDDGKDIRWVVGEGLHRPRSVIFPLRAEHPSGRSLAAFFKRSYPPPYAEERRRRWEATVRDGLVRSMDLESRLFELVEDEGITFSRALATDPATLSVVTLGVPGQPMGKVWRHIITPGARGDADRILRLSGRAARLIEQCSPEGIVAGAGAQVDAIDRRVARVRGVMPDSTLEAVERRMAELHRELDSSPKAMVYSHGDFSTTNILVDEGRIGLIDFTWPVRQRGFDLAHFAFRLEYDTAAPARMTSSLILALIEGYGDPEVTLQPGWRFVRLSKLLKVVEDGKRSALGKGSGRTRRALAEIESYI
ncbi:MAG: phosphotransferase [Acidimicrobiia bacterium]